MPHMANLSWNLSYLFIFLALNLMIMKENTTNSNPTPANSLLKNHNSTKWTW